MRAALLQLCSSDDPGENLGVVRGMMREAAENGAGFILTPEVTNCVSSSRARQNEVLCHEDADPTLAGLREEAAALGVWLLIGSLGLKTGDADGRFANRSFLIGPDGQIAARYDKIHMFDVEIGANDSFRESDGYRPGSAAVVAGTPFAKIGMSICYDIRFPYLYRDLAHAGAQVLAVPAAFHPVTGAAHWEVLLRARAIETGCYVLAPAQTGRHNTQTGKPRQSYGHSMAISPWGEVLTVADDAPGVVYVDLDLSEVENSRQRVPSMTHDRNYEGP
ncbi:carbon-nitrogen hydrolase family protein [Actibacterium lipolyticum]|uniref:2-oxoglutaramate amidase n=1 Tax=Actibacterium lipolyticum TaxID=1524263 RepID=A0A238KWK6_9RHOB|nr:carbon-nitrogen hydrolase family protein [Actibacterium lipolyticum]SMX46971.1 2-oxoglutaramate amidase [Actibacterium lipolyticum]